MKGSPEHPTISDNGYSLLSAFAVTSDTTTRVKNENKEYNTVFCEL